VTPETRDESASPSAGEPTEAIVSANRLAWRAHYEKDRELDDAYDFPRVCRYLVLPSLRIFEFAKPSAMSKRTAIRRRKAFPRLKTGPAYALFQLAGTLLTVLQVPERSAEIRVHVMNVKIVHAMNDMNDFV
jgi:hypothetical protein